MKSDGGFGNMGNLTIHSILKELTNERANKYRIFLKEKHPKEYQEYLEWEQWLKKK